MEYYAGGMRQGHSLVSESAGFRSIMEGYLSKSTTGKGYIQSRLRRLVVVDDRSPCICLVLSNRMKTGFFGERSRKD